MQWGSRGTCLLASCCGVTCLPRQGDDSYQPSHSHAGLPSPPAHPLPTPPADPGGFSIEGGFPGLASALLDSANASLHLGAEVRSIARSPGSDRLQLAWADAAAGGGAAIAAQSGDFDGIILAAPLEGSQLDLAGVPDLAPRFPRSFVSTVTTLVRGRVRASYFGQPAATQLQYGARSGGAEALGHTLENDGMSMGAFPLRPRHGALRSKPLGARTRHLLSGKLELAAPEIPGSHAAHSNSAGRVLVTADSPVPFSSLAKVQLAPGQPSLWRLTSPKTLSHAWLSIVFEAGWQVADATTWAAYPRWGAPGAYGMEGIAPAAGVPMDRHT